MIATITLNPSIDQHIIVPALLKDDANRALMVSHSAGGKGLNVSKVVRELGGRTHAYALAGGYVGGWWTHLLKTLDIRFTAYPISGETRINAVLTDVKDRTQTRVSAPGPAVTQKEFDSFLKKLCRLRRKATFWVLGGSLPANADPSTYQRFIKIIQENGGRCILDADGEALKRGVKAKPFLIKPNEFEIQRLLNRPFETVADYHKGAKELVRSGIHTVIVSLGAKGAVFVSERESFHVLGIDVPVKSKVGAGDSLIGGFLLGLCSKQSFQDAARLGIAASTSAVMREAPRLCLRSDIPILLPKVRIKRYNSSSR